MGVTTASTDTPETMANNIKNIDTSGPSIITQQVSLSPSRTNQGNFSAIFTFSNLSSILGIKSIYLEQQYTSFVCSFSISGNKITMKFWNYWSGTFSHSIKITAIGYGN